MDAALERLVRQRADGRCEYCRLPQPASAHCPSRSTTSSPATIKAAPASANLASRLRLLQRLQRPEYPRALTPQLASSRPLFNPRRHKWTHHFRYASGELIGRTAIGRTTVEVLRINGPNLIALRELLMDDGLF